MKPILEARRLHKSFGSVAAARDIDVAIEHGARVGLIGANGAGKTTFVNIVTGYVKPDSGQIKLEEKDITGLSPRRIAQAGVCRSFQVPQLFLSMSVEDNLRAALGVAMGYGSLLSRADQARMAQALDRLLTRFKLAEHRRRPITELAGGVRKLVDIAVAVSREPRILLLDEPTSGVAAEQKFMLMDIVMDALAAERVTVLFVEHDMEVVDGYADRVLAFYDGRIIADGPPAGVLRDRQVRELITGETD